MTVKSSATAVIEGMADERHMNFALQPFDHFWRNSG
jgi:hypothetical protein